jgi:hypothetical protein
MTSGLYSQFSYTFSKAIGDNAVRDPRNRQLSKGILDIDRTHVVKANGTYALPFGPNRKFLAKRTSRNSKDRRRLGIVLDLLVDQRRTPWALLASTR